MNFDENWIILVDSNHSNKIFPLGDCEEDNMYKILKAEKLNEVIYLMVVEAPRVAQHCQPGQFIIVKKDDEGERIPLTICDYDREAGTITIVFQPIGILNGTL